MFANCRRGGWVSRTRCRKPRASSGEWLVFTDADVKFRADALRRVVALHASEPGSSALLGDVERSGFLGYGADYVFRDGISTGGGFACGEQSEFAVVCGRRGFSNAEARGLRGMRDAPAAGDGSD